MEVVFEHHNSSSDASVIIRHIVSPQTQPQELKINHHNYVLPSLVIQFCLQTIEQYWSIDSKPHHERTHTKLLHLKLYPSVYMSDDMFYRVVQGNLVNFGEEFDRNYRHVVIHDMIGRVREIIDGHQNLDVFVGVTLVVDHLFEGRIEDQSSILQLLKRMEVDEDVVNDDCVICLEELGMEKELLCMPCSHTFHGDCITTWIENGHSCPICRYNLLVT